MNFAERLKEAWEVRQSAFSPIIAFDHPLKTAVLSLTGTYCALNCAHCGGFYLKHMAPVWEADVHGATSCLISGGCDSSGKVPVAEHVSEVKALRDGRLMNWHVGLIERKGIEAIAPLVDLVSFDFVGDTETIQEVYGLRRSAEDCFKTYRLLTEYFTVIPHITVGLKGGEIKGESRALKMLEEVQPEALVLLVFIPTAGTRYARRQPPEVEEAMGIVVEARTRLPRTHLHIGCMRPRGDYRRAFDVLAVRAGVNGIVSPVSEAVALASDLGLRVQRGEECCAVGWLRNRRSGGMGV